MSDTKVVIAMVAPQEPFELFSDFWEGVWSAAYDLAPLGVAVNSLAVETLDAEQEAQCLAELLLAKVDAIVLVPAQTKHLDPWIARHRQQGTFVVTAFHDAPWSDRTLFVGPDYKLSGRLAGDMLVSGLKPNSRIAAMTGGGLNTAQDEGFREILQESGLLFGVTDFPHAEALLTGMDSFDGLYLGCPESPLFGEILKRMKRPVRAVTFGLTDVTKPYLESGGLCAVIDSDRFYQGYLAVQKAYECVHGAAIESGWVPIPSAVVLASHVKAKGEKSSMHTVMDAVLRQNTKQLQNYKQELALAKARETRVEETDALMQVLNSRRFDEALERELVRYEDGAAPVALLAVRLEDAEAMASLLGQKSLDDALQAVASALQVACGSQDTVARTGLAEFSILMPDTVLASAQAVCDRIVELVKEAQDANFPYSLSMGLVGTAMRGVTALELKRRAQDCLLKQCA